MGKKLKQVTDNIHGTIYLSAFESELISTPYFYRLHDIYQSSTVYMTFPSNRTKRYEHSLGTMELAGDMLYSALSNSEIKDKNKLFDCLGYYFGNVVDLIIKNYHKAIAFPQYLANSREGIGQLLSSYMRKRRTSQELQEEIMMNIKKAVVSGYFTDSALDYYQYSAMQINEKENNANIDIKSYFLYRCLLQAVRIVALFHDVGHPPFSHIIENVLKDLYNTYKGNNDNSNINSFIECIGSYYDLEIQTFISRKILSESKFKLHEKIGISFLQSAINDTVPDLIEEVLGSDCEKDCKIAGLFYYILVVEFAISILAEQDVFFESFHKIVDGVLDADRLDYITRDTLNSGVNWGKIPYKRLINSAKLFCLEQNEISEHKCDSAFVIAYPQKLVDDIEDIFILRYKIYARINFHHRCVKTANALSSCVKMLADDYLNNNNDCIDPEISKLWSSLELVVGDRNNRVILWNDSWLISTLNQALVRIDEKIFESDEKDIELKLSLLKKNLEEILLNRKSFYSVFKRGTDNQEFVKKVFKYADITKEKIDALINKEFNKSVKSDNEEITIENLLNSPMTNTLDSLNRISDFMKEKDLEQLDQCFPTQNKSLKEIVFAVLQAFKEQGELLDFIIYINKDRGRIGIPEHDNLFDEIFLYKKDKCFTLDEEVSLKPQIKAITPNIPWLFIYIVPNDQHADINQLNEKILNQLAIEIAKSLKARLEELFPSLLIDKE